MGLCVSEANAKDVVSKLLALGASPFLKTNEGKTAKDCNYLTMMCPLCFGKSC